MTSSRRTMWTHGTKTIMLKSSSVLKVFLKVASILLNLLSSRDYKAETRTGRIMKLSVLCHYGLSATLRTRHPMAFVAALATISALYTLYSAVFMTVHPQSPLYSENWLSLQIPILDTQSSTTDVSFGILQDFTTKSPEIHHTTESRVPAEQLPTETSISVAILNATSTEASSSRSVKVPIRKESFTETSSTVIALKASSTTKPRNNIQRRSKSKTPTKSNSIVIASRAEGRIPAEASSSATVPKEASKEASSSATSPKEASSSATVPKEASKEASSSATAPKEASSSATVPKEASKEASSSATVPKEASSSATVPKEASKEASSSATVPKEAFTESSSTVTATALIASSTIKNKSNVAHVIHRRTKSIIPTSSYVTALKASSPTKQGRYFPGVNNQKTESKIPAKSSNIVIAPRVASTNKNFKISLNAEDEYDRKPSVSLKNITISYPVACNETNCLEFLSKSDTMHLKRCGQMTSEKQSGVKIEQSTCTFLPYKDRTPVALSSPPGSGNTWLRGLLERATGVCTGYGLCDTEMRARGFLGEQIVSGKVLVVKTHSIIPQWVGERVRVSWEGSYGSAVLLIRNPVQAVIAEWNRIMTLEMKKNGTQTNGSHINVVSEAIFGRWSGAVCVIVNTCRAGGMYWIYTRKLFILPRRYIP